MAKKKTEIFKKLKTNDNNILPKTIIVTILLLLIYAVIIFSPVGKVTLPPIGSVLENDIIAKNETRYIDKEATFKNIAQITEHKQPFN